MGYVFVFNLVEIVLWSCMGLGFAVYAFVTGRQRPRSFLIAVVFALFAVSDVIELSTGAWWRPWWLMLWKTVCLVTLVAFAVDYRRKAKQAEIDVFESRGNS